MYLCIETNLKKQGMLPLTFSDVADYDKVLPSDRVSLVGLDKLGPGQVSDGTSVLCSVQYSLLHCSQSSVLKHADGSTDQFMLNHTMNQSQVEWFKAGNALNRMKQLS